MSDPGIFYIIKHTGSPDKKQMNKDNINFVHNVSRDLWICISYNNNYMNDVPAGFHLLVELVGHQPAHCRSQ